MLAPPARDIPSPAGSNGSLPTGLSAAGFQLDHQGRAESPSPSDGAHHSGQHQSRHLKSPEHHSHSHLHSHLHSHSCSHLRSHKKDKQDDKKKSHDEAKGMSHTQVGPSQSQGVAGSHFIPGKMQTAAVAHETSTGSQSGQTVGCSAVRQAAVADTHLLTVCTDEGVAIQHHSAK